MKPQSSENSLDGTLMGTFNISGHIRPESYFLEMDKATTTGNSCSEGIKKDKNGDAKRVSSTGWWIQATMIGPDNSNQIIGGTVICQL